MNGKGIRIQPSNDDDQRGKTAAVLRRRWKFSTQEKISCKNVKKEESQKKRDLMCLSYFLTPPRIIYGFFLRFYL